MPNIIEQLGQIAADLQTLKPRTTFLDSAVSALRTAADCVQWHESAVAAASAPKTNSTPPPAKPRE